MQRARGRGVLPDPAQVYRELQDDPDLPATVSARYTSLRTEPDPSVRRQAIEDLWAKEGPELTTTETVAHGSTHGDVGP
jgi:hypothetical protein